MSKIDEELFGNMNVRTDYHESDGLLVQSFTSNVDQLLADNKKRRNAESSWRIFDPKQEYHQVLDLDMAAILMIKEKHGVDILGCHVDWNYVFKLIRQNYPYLMTTNARMDN